MDGGNSKSGHQTMAPEKAHCCELQYIHSEKPMIDLHLFNLLLHQGSNF